jgi:hypothetical protein
MAHCAFAVVMRRRPWALIVLAATIVAIVAGIAFVTPELREMGYSSRSSRTLAAAVSLPTSFGIYAGIALASVAMSIGVLRRIVRLWREVTRDDALS